MREKLIELLITAKDLVVLNRQADFLLANGVRVAEDTNVPCEWIPVTERLPESMVWVLCTLGNGEIDILAYDHIMDDWDMCGRPNRCYSKGSVTHWMPLPEAPKEDA